MCNVEGFIIASLNFTNILPISAFAFVSYASPSEATLLPIFQDSKTGVKANPLSESAILQQLVQNQQANPNQDPSPQSCPMTPKTESEYEKPSASKLNEQIIQITGSTVFGGESETITLEEFIEKN